MKRAIPATAICIDSISDSDEAQKELHQREWSVGHVTIDGIHQVTGLKKDIRIVAEAPTEFAAWLLACDKANEHERLWRDRN